MRHRHSESFGGAPQPENVSNAELSWSVLGGHYHDPESGVVKHIAEKYETPEENIKETIMKAFELAGLIKPFREMVGPMVHLGMLPKSKKGVVPPRYNPGALPASEFTDRLEEKIVSEFVDDDACRNIVECKVVEKIEQRYAYSQMQELELWEFGKSYTARNEIPPALRIIRAMASIYPPEDAKNKLKVKLPPETRLLAPDIYWMMLREQLEGQSPINTVA